MGAFTLRTTRRLPQRGGELRTQGLAQSKESGLVGERRAPPRPPTPLSTSLLWPLRDPVRRWRKHTLWR